MMRTDTKFNLLAGAIFAIGLALLVAYLLVMGQLAVTFIGAVHRGDTGMAAVLGGVFVGLCLASAVQTRRRDAPRASVGGPRSDIDAIADAHQWHGGYVCSCGHELNSPAGFTRHVLEVAGR